MGTCSGVIGRTSEGYRPSGAAGVGGVASVIGRGISTTVGGLLIVLGLRSLLVAPDPETQPLRWMEAISSISPPRAFDFGVALFPIQIKNLAIFVACLGLIATASLGPGDHAVALGLALLVFAIPVLAEFKLEGHTVLLVSEIALAIVLVLLLPRSLRRSPAGSMGWL
jgi:hypothetical protein